jgi:2-keto-4-pentenoate hydratase/2-oxohepta-3-ene-1,7-dioic acid hydratase in catechol pathway
MRIVRYTYNGIESYGIVEKERIICLPVLAQVFSSELPAELDGFIASEMAKETAETLARKAKFPDLEKASIPIYNVKIFAPIVYPPKIICLGWNYFDHASETKINIPDEPVIFMKPRTAIIGPNQKIIKRPFVNELDYEGELAIIVGKKAKDVPESEASKYIFGYTILNDVSARDFQFKDKQWTRGKGFDTFAPIGPCIVTSEQLANTEDLSIKTWVNGELRQNGSTKDMVFNTGQIIYHLSRVMTLEPCDIIATGTPSGVGMAMKPQKWLKSGDVVRIEIEGIGALENTVEEK